MKGMIINFKVFINFDTYIKKEFVIGLKIPKEEVLHLEGLNYVYKKIIFF